jgi:hypothetical protein
MKLIHYLTIIAAVVFLCFVPTVLFYGQSKSLSSSSPILRRSPLTSATKATSSDPLSSSISSWNGNPIHMACSSIKTYPVVYQATYRFFQDLSIPCVLFGGSAIGVSRHHGIIPRGEKDIDIACWSNDWSQDRHLLEIKLNEINPEWYYSMQGYYVPIQGDDSFYLDIWLHGPDPGPGPDPMNSQQQQPPQQPPQQQQQPKGTLNDPTRCLGFDRRTFENFPMYKILPELASLLIKLPSKKFNRKKHAWWHLSQPYTCFMFYNMFGHQYISDKKFTSIQIAKHKRSPVWPAGMFWDPNRPAAMGLFGTSLVPVPSDMKGYTQKRYGDIMNECGQKIWGNLVSCDKWLSSGLVQIKKYRKESGGGDGGDGGSDLRSVESLVVQVDQKKVVQHQIYQCTTNGVYSCENPGFCPLGRK